MAKQKDPKQNLPFILIWDFSLKKKAPKCIFLVIVESIHTSPDKDDLRTGGLTSFSRHTFAVLEPGSSVIELDSHLRGDSSKLVGDEVCHDFVRR